ncbi:hypothetical protein ABZV14_16595 [Streptosporangium canum]|uniref:hypothetical protein n=1 Tax=Streptosporangium canum TaxID=324952 RepID=UPI0033BA4986
MSRGRQQGRGAPTGRPPLDVGVGYDTSRRDLRVLLSGKGFLARREPAGYDRTMGLPRPDGPGPLKHGFVLRELSESGHSWIGYHEGRSWQADMTDIRYAPGSTDVRFRLDALSCRVVVRIHTGRPDDLINVAEGIVDRIGYLFTRPSARWRAEIRQGRVTLESGSVSP